MLSLLVINPIGLYIYNKTYGKETTDCMINYVSKYYPNGCEYTIKMDWETFNHIDKCWLENEYMELNNNVTHCFMTQAPLVNTPYCFYSLIFEKSWKILKKNILKKS